MICSGDSAAEWLRERNPLPSTPPPSTYKQQKKGERREKLKTRRNNEKLEKVWKRSIFTLFTSSHQFHSPPAG